MCGLPAHVEPCAKVRGDWHSGDDEHGVIKVVMTGDAANPKEWQQHIRGKARRELLAKRAKDPDDALKVVIVRDMWLTGFDAPSMHTMYVDKPMRGQPRTDHAVQATHRLRGRVCRRGWAATARSAQIGYARRLGPTRSTSPGSNRPVPTTHNPQPSIEAGRTQPQTTTATPPARHRFS